MIRPTCLLDMTNHRSAEAAFVMAGRQLHRIGGSPLEFRLQADLKVHALPEGGTPTTASRSHACFSSTAEAR